MEYTVHKTGAKFQRMYAVFELVEAYNNEGVGISKSKYSYHIPVKVTKNFETEMEATNNLPNKKGTYIVQEVYIVK